MNLEDLHYKEFLPPVKDLEAWDNYIKLVKKALCRGSVSLQGKIKEKHHIVPKCYLPSTLTLEESFIGNKVILSSQEHYKAHYYLAKALGGKMIPAFKRMGYVYKYNTASFEADEDPEEINKIKWHSPKAQPYKRYWRKAK